MEINAILNQAVAAARANQHSNALDLLKKGLKAHPGEKRLLACMGQTLEQTRAYEDALTIYSRLVDEKGDVPIPFALGMARCSLALSRFAQAKKILDPVLKRIPDNADALTGMARIAHYNKQADQAMALVNKALAQNAAYQPAIHEKARILISLKEPDKALQTVEKNVLRGDPYGDSIDLWINTLREQKRDLYLTAKLEELAKTYPLRSEFQFGLALNYIRAGEIDKARPILEALNQRAPTNYKILYELGVMERIAGNIDASREYLRRVLEAKPDHAPALRTYSTDHKHAYGDPVFSRLNTVAAGLTSMSVADQTQLHFALGRAYDDVGELAASFRHYAVGGAKRKKEMPFKEASNIRMFNVMKAVVNRDSMSQVEQQGCPSDLPVFILGMPRSGTSLIEQVLSSHPEIYGAGELKYMTSALENIDILGRRLKFGEVEAAFAYEENASYERRGQWYIDKLKNTAGKEYKRIVDKMPGNFNFAGLIGRVLPNAKIIHSMRHPVETCLSCYRIHFAEGHQWSYNLSELGRYYKRYWELMSHWREQFPGMMYEIRYEDNVANLEPQARSLIDFLGLDWYDECLKFYETDRPVKTASAAQVRQPIYNTSTNRWRKYEHLLGPLLEEIGDIVNLYEAELADR